MIDKEIKFKDNHFRAKLILAIHLTKKYNSECENYPGLTKTEFLENLLWKGLRNETSIS